MNALTWPPIDRFPEQMSDAYIDDRIRVRPETMTRLSSLPEVEASSDLDLALRSIVVPTTQMRFVLRAMTSKARAYSRQAYRDQATFLRNIHSGNDSIDGLQLTILTGLAGLGKTETLKAFQLLHSDTGVEIPNHAAFHLRPAWLLTARGGISTNQLILPHFRANRARSRVGLASEEVARECFSQGLSLLMADEFQFISRNNRSALAANTILRLAKIGPPLIVATNYSLLHAFMRRSQEDKQRFFADILEIRPESPSSFDWQSTVNELLTVATELQALLEASNIHQKLHSLTFGIDRYLARLLRLSYEAMRSRGATHAIMDDVHKAYSSINYAAPREDIRLLEGGVLNRSAMPSDLYCPVAAKDCLESSSGYSNKDAAETLISQAELNSSLNRSERESANSLAKQGKTAIPRPSKPTYDADSLIDAAHRFSNREGKPPA